MPRRPRRTIGSSPLATFGKQVTRYRDMAELSQDQLGGRVHVTGSAIGKIERGESRCERKIAQALDESLNTGGALESLWEDLVQNSPYPTWFNWPKIEAQARVLRTFQLSVIHGLLQTESYARALLGSDDAVNARLERQVILTREDPPPPLLVVLLDESVLQREVGGPEAMRQQLEHLAAMASKRVITQVVPSKVHDGLSGSFVVATLDDRTEVAYMDTAARGLTMGENEDIETLAESFETLRSVALPVGQSLDLIARTAEQKWT